MMTPTLINRGALIALGVAAIAALNLCSSPKRDGNEDISETEPKLVITPVSLDQVTGFASDTVIDALPPFLLSCGAMGNYHPDALVHRAVHPEFTDIAPLFGTFGDWSALCATAAEAQEKGPEAARSFWLQNFTALKLTIENVAEDSRINDDTITGYFEPIYAGRRTPVGRFTAPILSRPTDLVAVNLGQFKEDLKGQRIAGRVIDGRLVPYDDHGAIAAAPPAASEVLGYMDPNDLLFMQIQGSGRVQFSDGVTERIGYAAQNGHSYLAIGRPLIAEGQIAREDMSMQAIADWLSAASPEEAARIREMNPSYVFFRQLDNLADDDLGPLGAQGVQLTSRRSIAVDPRFTPYGTPVWMRADATDQTTPINRLMVAQDTGGAIRGVQRADVFFGAGDEAAALAGPLNTTGELIVLVPKESLRRLEDG